MNSTKTIEEKKREDIVQFFKKTLLYNNSLLKKLENFTGHSNVIAF